jgi:hypothetical protein
MSGCCGEEKDLLLPRIEQFLIHPVLNPLLYGVSHPRIENDLELNTF